MILFKTWVDGRQEITCDACVHELNVPEDHMRRITQDEAFDMSRPACTKCGAECSPEEIE